MIINEYLREALSITPLVSQEGSRIIEILRSIIKIKNR